jgi:arsenite methyltransferase
MTGRSIRREQVRAHYADVARRVASEGCCGDASCEEEAFGPALYSADELADVPAAASAASLGCGNPIMVADLTAGEVVLDLGAGGGIDVLLSARRVGPAGKAYGLDMTEEMLELARRNALDAGVDNVEFLDGYIEAIPLPDESVDVVISNCVINLSADKRRVFAEVHRVLRTGGRVAISDVVADDRLSDAEILRRGSHVGCVAGALRLSEYRSWLEAEGFEEVDILTTHSVADGVDAAIIRARK